MAIFPASPNFGDTYTVNNVKYVWNGYGWSASAPQYLRANLDVDLTTTPPTNNQALVYNSTSTKWVPGEGGYTYSATAPLFTTIGVGHIWIKSTTMEQFLYVKDDTNADLWVTLGSSALANMPTPNRNIIMNGCGLINQKYASSGAFPINSLGAYIVDRWAVGTTVNLSNKVTAGRNYSNPSLPDGFTSCIGFKTTTAAAPGSTDYFDAGIAIEGRRLRGLNWGSASANSLTLSFWLYTNIAGNYPAVLRKFANNGALSWTYVHNVTHSGTGWQYFSFTIPPLTLAGGYWDYDSDNAMLLLTFPLTVGTTYRTSTVDAWQTGNFVSSTTSTQVTTTLNHIYCITGVQMEIGTVATTYEHLTFDQELDRCLAYFQKSYNYEVSIGTQIYQGYRAFMPSYSNFAFSFPFQKQFIKTPTLYMTPATIAGFSRVGEFDADNGNTYFASFRDSGRSSANFQIANAPAAVGLYSYFHWWGEAEPNFV